MSDGQTRRMLQDWFSAVQPAGLSGTAVARTAEVDVRFEGIANEVFRNALSWRADERKAINQCRARAEREMQRVNSTPMELPPRFAVGGIAVR